MLLAAILTIATPIQMPPSPDPRALSRHPLCRAVDPGASKQVKIRIIRPHTLFRVSPSADQIVRDGDRMTVPGNSPVWHHFASAICDTAPLASTPRRDVIYRIFIVPEGHPDADGILIEYPDFSSPHSTVLMKAGDRLFELDRLTVRQLLDLAPLG